MELTVKDVMTTRVVSVKRGASFRTMAAALREYRVSAFPVVDDDGKVIGVVSEADMLAKAALDSEPEGMSGMIAGILRRKEYEKARGTTAAGGCDAGSACSASGWAGRPPCWAPCWC